MSYLIPRLEFAAQSLFKKQSYCPHCHSKSLENIAKKYVVINIKKCNNCYLNFTDPIYKPLLVANLYKQLYTAEGSTTCTPNSEQLNDLIDNCFRSSDKFFGERIQSIKSQCNGNKILELGSSWGYFLYQAKQQGFDVTGVEISKPRREFGINNLKVNIVDSFNKLDNDNFDLFYTAHTLEHFVDLSTIFKEIHRVLKDKGQLLIEVPNFNFAELGKKVLSAVGAVHPIGFSNQFFQENLPKYGFKILGFYDSWNCFPKHQVDKSSTENIILLAEKNINQK